MKIVTRHSPLAYLISILTLISGYAFISARWSNKSESYFTIEQSSGKHVLSAADEPSRFVPSLHVNSESNISKSTFALTVPSMKKRNSGIPAAYMALDEIETSIDRLLRTYPDLIYREQIGTSTTLGLPIWGIKISDHARESQDEARILFAGVYHAREPIGSNICLALMQRLCSGYGRNEQITKWVNSLEIWFVPVVNPDGYRYIFENSRTFPWWRKNLRDNDGNGRFDPLYDGVDLNRNYDFNWKDGGDDKPGSWFYRGADPFSENETRAIRDLTLRENFVIGISYHSYGESILFPWGNFKRPPDLDLIVNIATKMAARIRRESGYGNYSVLPLNGLVGQSSIWMYGHLRVFDYIVEVGTEYFPAAEKVPSIVDENVHGAFYLLERMLGTGIKGHVFDLHSRQPLLAKIKVRGYHADHVNSRRTEPESGAFYRLLKQGNYTLEIVADGYHRKVLPAVRVEKGEVAELEIGLIRKNGYTY